MSGIGGIGGLAGASGAGGVGGANPLSGLAGSMGSGTDAMSGMGDMGAGSGSGSGAAASGIGLGPVQPASESQGAAFGDTLRSMVIEQPSASKAYSSELSMRFAAGDTSIDPHKLALASAKAGVEIQMATRTISSTVSAVRTLFQMQV
jgi:flagellar hook-basal body complex protein FliE